MKCLFFILLPFFVTIALLFTFQNRDFNFVEMLSIFSNFSFNNGYNMLLLTSEVFSSVSSSYNSISTANDFFEAISAIGSMLAGVFVGIGQIFGVVAAYLIDLVSNISSVLRYLLGF